MSTVSRVIDMIDNLDLPKSEVNEILKELRDAVELRLLRPDFDAEEFETTGLYKNVYRIEVLSDENAAFMDLADINYQITEGHASGLVTWVASGELTPEEMFEELKLQGSDPDFFSDGEDDDEE